jgi:ParB family chromosome partitioning protein
MSSKTKRLGSLVDIFQSEKLEGTIKKIKLSKIFPAEVQPRKERLKGVEELAKSLQEVGLLQPILVTKEKDDSFKIIAGERRYHAARMINWQEIECKILDKDEKETYKLAVIENLQRENLSPYEEVEAIALLKEKFKYTDSDLASILGKSRNYMNELLSIQALNEAELEKCKKIGVDSKNLLIQAVQASKKGNLDRFLKSVENGEVKTVREAKEFNREKTAEIIESKTKQKQLKEEPKKQKFQLTRVGREIILTFEELSTADRAASIIQKALQQL